MGNGAALPRAQNLGKGLRHRIGGGAFHGRAFKGAKRNGVVDRTGPCHYPSPRRLGWGMMGCLPSSRVAPGAAAGMSRIVPHTSASVAHAPSNGCSPTACFLYVPSGWAPRAGSVAGGGDWGFRNDAAPTWLLCPRPSLGLRNNGHLSIPRVSPFLFSCCGPYQERQTLVQRV